MIELTGAANLLKNSLLTDNLIVSPTKLNDYSTFNNFAASNLVTDVEDYADISPKAYELSLMENLEIPKSPNAAYNNNFSNMIVDYLNRDIRFP